MKKEEFGKRNPVKWKRGGFEGKERERKNCKINVHSIQDNFEINGNKEMEEPDYLLR